MKNYFIDPLTNKPVSNGVGNQLVIRGEGELRSDMLDSITTALTQTFAQNYVVNVYTVISDGPIYLIVVGLLMSVTDNQQLDLIKNNVDSKMIANALSEEGNAGLRALAGIVSDHRLVIYVGESREEIKINYSESEKRVPIDSDKNEKKTDQLELGADTKDKNDKNENPKKLDNKIDKKDLDGNNSDIDKGDKNGYEAKVTTVTISESPRFRLVSANVLEKIVVLTIEDGKKRTVLGFKSLNEIMGILTSVVDELKPELSLTGSRYYMSETVRKSLEREFIVRLDNYLQDLKDKYVVNSD